ncbi:MAG: hypothetical protein MUF18_11485 [Fimbriiglobus sp.]|jgi:hypothetical protein|nr:hypothetical protein [Fimbriiglobus sp.]
MSQDDATPIGQPETDPLASPAEDVGVFWHTYSPRFEMPISYVVSGLVIALLALLAALVLWIQAQPAGDYKEGPKLGLTDGDDAFGEGEAGQGGVADPTVLGQNAPTRDDAKEILPDIDTTLPQVKEDLAKSFNLEDPTSIIPLNDTKMAPYAALDKALRDQILGIGQKKGDGTTGKGGEGGNPNGAGTGTGADSTRARTMRWVIAFRTASGRDYLDQLQSLGAKIIVPTADGKGALYFRDLSGNPPVGKPITDPDWQELSGLVQFSDYTARTRQDVGQALGMGNLPKGFWAYFPKTLEQELAKKEVGFQQRRSEDIEETKFECVMKNGKYELVVTRQTLKK